MIICNVRPVLIIHAMLPQIWLKASEKKYITENFEKPMNISMITYNSDLTLHSIGIPYLLSSIMLNSDEINAEIKFV